MTANKIDAAWAAAFEHALALSCELGRVGDALADVRDASGRPWARLAFAAPSADDIASAKSWADAVVEAASQALGEDS